MRQTPPASPARASVLRGPTGVTVAGAGRPLSAAAGTAAAATHAAKVAAEQGSADRASGAPTDGEGVSRQQLQSMQLVARLVGLLLQRLQQVSTRQWEQPSRLLTQSLATAALLVYPVRSFYSARCTGVSTASKQQGTHARCLAAGAAELHSRC